MEKVIVIGGGAAGIFAALKASENNKVIIIEKNEKLGMKIGITGKGRCNITNSASEKEFLKNIVQNGNFFKKSFYKFSNIDLMNFLEENNFKYKIERGNRVFPVSDSALEFVRFLIKLVKKNKNIEIINQKVIDIEFQESIKKITLEDKKNITCKKLIIATGGTSYTRTGSTGDGYLFAKKAGHTILNPEPVLIPLNLENHWITQAHPFQLKNISLKIKKKKRVLWEEIGEMTIEYYGIGGPLTLTASSLLKDFSNERLILDLKPGLSNEKLFNRIKREIENDSKINLSQLIRKLMPGNLVSGFISSLKINKLIASDLSEKEINQICENIKNIELPIKEKRPIEEAIVTRGGVSVKEINSETMESRLVEGLYFAGEILDIDALTGGFNLQIAFSTGWVAGSSV